MPLENYFSDSSLDLSEDSKAYKDLMSRIEDEVTSKEILLTNPDSHLPSFLTPEMRQWYLRYIDGPRCRALEDIKSRFNSMKGKKGTHGFLLEAKLDEIDAEEYKNIKHEKSQFLDDADVNTLSKNLSEKQAEYQNICAEQGRDAKEWFPVRYWLGILGVIIIEGLLNFESFTKIPNVTPFFATGMTLGAAAFIGYAAHRHGIFIRQFGEEFGGHVGRKNKSTAIVRELIALLLLLVAMGIVAWGRYNLILPIIEDCLIDPESCNVSPWVQLIGAMLGNIGVYLFGVLWSYWHHDPVPSFMELRIETEQLENDYNKRHKKDITDRVRRHKSKAEKERAACRQADKDFQTFPEYNKLRAEFQKLQHKDSIVLSLLEGYKSKLTRIIRQDQKDIVFIGYLNIDELAEGDTIKSKVLNADEYQGVAIKLKFITEG